MKTRLRGMVPYGRIARFITKWLSVGTIVGGACFILVAGTTNVADEGQNPPAMALARSSAPPPRRVMVQELAPRPVDETISLPGVVEAIDDINLAATIPGAVEWVGVKEGEAVKKGQALFRIDQRARQAQLEDAKARREWAQRQVERQRQLQTRGVASVVELDGAETELRRAEASLNLAETQLALGVISTPVDGIVDRIDIDMGEYAHDGDVLAHLVNIDRVKVIIGVAERDVDAVSRQDKAAIRVDALDMRFDGHIAHVAYAANLNTNTFETTIEVDNPDHAIRPGMVASTEVVIQHIPDALLVPLFAVMRSLDHSIVFVERDGKAVSVPVELGSIRGAEIVIESGLNPGDRVVTKGQRDLADGQPVEVATTDGLTLAVR